MRSNTLAADVSRPSLPDWRAVMVANLSIDAKAELNRTRLALDEMATATLRDLCGVHDGAARPADAVNRAAELVAAIRGLPLLV